MGKTILVGVITGVVGIALGFFLGVIYVSFVQTSAPEERIGGASIETKAYNKEEYMRDSLQIYNVSSRWISSGFGDKYPFVEYKIKNLGNKTLSDVDIKMYFFDKAGNAIFEDEQAAIWTSEIFSNATGPLKPNYIKKRVAGAEDCPSEWDEGRVKIEIVDIEFE